MQECIQSWLGVIEKWDIPYSTDFSLVDCLVDPVTTRLWNIAGIPNDSFSLDNCVIATHCQRWPLLIDHQGIKYIL